MIAKFSSGNAFGGALGYDLRLGREEQWSVEILDAHGLSVEYQLDGTITADPSLLVMEFELHCLLCPLVREPVHHWVLSWGKGEQLSNEEMTARAKEFLEGMGYGNTQYIIIRHPKENQHCHVICNSIDRYGNRISTFQLIKKAHEIARDITNKYGYQWGIPASRDQNVHAPHEAARYFIEPLIKDSLNDCKTVDDLPEILKQQGVVCRFRDDKDGKHIGISFSVTWKGQQHTFAGSSVDRTLSLKRIVSQINAVVQLKKSIDSIQVEETKPVVKPQVVETKETKKKGMVGPEDSGTPDSPNLVSVPEAPIAPQPSHNLDIQHCAKAILSLADKIDKIAIILNDYKLSEKRKYDKNHPQDYKPRYRKAWDYFREQVDRLNKDQESPVDAGVLAEVANSADDMMLHMINLLVGVGEDYYRITSSKESKEQYQSLRKRLEEMMGLNNPKKPLIALFEGYLNEGNRRKALEKFKGKYEEAKLILEDYPRTAWMDVYSFYTSRIQELEPGKYRLENRVNKKWEKVADDFKSFRINVKSNGDCVITVTDLAGKKRKYDQLGNMLSMKTQQSREKLTRKNWK